MSTRALVAAALSIGLVAGLGSMPTGRASAATSPNLDLAAYLSASPVLGAAQIDLSGIRARIIDFRPTAEQYVGTDRLGYKVSSFENRTQRDQTFWTTQRAVSVNRATTYKIEHTLSVDTMASYEFTTGGAVLPTHKFSFSIRFGYAATLGNAYTDSRTDTVTMIQQPVLVGPGQSVTVEEWYEQGRYDASGTMTFELTGDVSFGRCGQTESVSIGTLLSDQSRFGLAKLPDWLRVTGGRVIATSALDFSDTPAVAQRVRTTLVTATGETRVETRTVDSSAASTSAPRPRVDSSRSHVPTFTGPPTCLPRTVDGSAVLLSDGRIVDPEWGMTVPGPEGVRFVAASGARWPGVGSFLSALDDMGNAYWFQRRGHFTKVNVPTKIVRTVDGVALLGEDGSVYDAAWGQRIPAPSGVAFSDVSGVHHYGDAFYYSAIGRDGNAYWSERGAAFTRVALPVRALDTIDGAIILGENGRLFVARDGREISNPGRITPASVSGAVTWIPGSRRGADSYVAHATVIDSRSGVWTSIGGSELVYRRWDGGTTNDGFLGITSSGGYLLNSRFETLRTPQEPANSRFIAVSGGPDWPTYRTISAVTTDGRVFWSSDGQNFREVDF